MHFVSAALYRLFLQERSTAMGPWRESTATVTTASASMAMARTARGTRAARGTDRRRGLQRKG